MAAASCHMPSLQQVGKTGLGLNRARSSKTFKNARPTAAPRSSVVRCEAHQNTPLAKLLEWPLKLPSAVVAACFGIAATFMSGDAQALEQPNAPTMSVMDLYYGKQDAPVAAPVAPIAVKSVSAPALGTAKNAATMSTLQPASSSSSASTGLSALAAVAVGIGAALAVRGGSKEKLAVEVAGAQAGPSPKAGTKMAIKAGTGRVGGTTKVGVKQAAAAGGGTKFTKPAGGTTKVAVKQGTTKIAVKQAPAKAVPTKGTVIKGAPVRGGSTKVAVGGGTSRLPSPTVKIVKQAPPKAKASRAAAAAVAEEPVKKDDTISNLAIGAVFGVTLATCVALTGSISPTKSTSSSPPVSVEELAVPKAPAPVASKPLTTAVIPPPAPAPAVKVAAAPAPPPPPAPAAPAAPTPAPPAPAPAPAPAPVAVAKKAEPAPTPAPAVVSTPKPAPAPAPAPKAAPVAATAEASEDSKTPTGTIVAGLLSVVGAAAIAVVYKNQTETLFKPPAPGAPPAMSLLRTPRPRDDVPGTVSSRDVPVPIVGATVGQDPETVALTEVYQRLLDNPLFQEKLSAALAAAGVPYNPADLKELLINSPAFKAKLQTVTNALPEAKLEALEELQTAEKLAEFEAIINAAVTKKP